MALDEIDEMISTVDRNGDGRISYSEFRWTKKCENEDRNLPNLKGCLNIAFFTPVPLIVGRWYIHQITRKWCFGSQGGFDKSSFGTFNLSHANLKRCLNLIKCLQNIHSIYQGWWWAPSRWSSRKTRWWRWRLLRRPTNAFFKKTAQTRATH